MVDLSDVARLAGVAKSTASRALSGHGSVAAVTRSRVTAAAASLQYVPSPSAVTLATGRARAIGVMTPGIERWYFAQILEGARTALQGSGFAVTLLAPDVAPADLVRRVDGVITIGLSARGAASHLVGPDRVGPETAALESGDEALLSERAAEHLIASGHTDIVFLGGEPPGSGGWPVDVRRRQGFENAMRHAGLTPRFVSCTPTLGGGYTAAADMLGGLGAPTAVVGLTDDVAVGAMIAARRLGISVPSALSIVGIEDQPTGAQFGLTTVTSSPLLRGQSAASTLLSLLGVRAPDPTVVFGAPRLVVRGSSAPFTPAHRSHGGEDAFQLVL